MPLMLEHKKWSHVMVEEVINRYLFFFYLRGFKVGNTIEIFFIENLHILSHHAKACKILGIFLYSSE